MPLGQTVFSVSKSLYSVAPFLSRKLNYFTRGQRAASSGVKDLAAINDPNFIGSDFDAVEQREQIGVAGGIVAVVQHIPYELRKGYDFLWNDRNLGAGVLTNRLPEVQTHQTDHEHG